MESADELELSDYSETTEEVAEVPELSATEEEKPKPTYSSKELDELVAVLKKMVFLSGIGPDDWTEQCDEIIRTWFLDTQHLMLIVYFSPKHRLTVRLTYPTEPVLEIVYFLREPNHIFSIDNFHDDVTFGQMNDDVDGTLLLLMENLYTSIFFHKTDWSETNREQFLAAIHTFLSQLTTMHYKLASLTVLYVPHEAVIDDAEKTETTDDGFIHRLESIAEFWINQLRVCISDSEQIVPYDLLCPRDEYEFWIYRCEVLLAVKYQMNHKDFLRVFNVLVSSQSIFVRPLNELAARIDKEIDRAQDNVRYLKLLLEPCNDLWISETPADIPMKLPRILNTIRFIWLNSNYMKHCDFVTKLFRYVGNQIIHFCCQKIDVSAIFNGDVQKQIKIANMSIDCCIYYKVMYEKLANHENWMPLQSYLIFNHLDSFIKRVYDFIEICESIVIFSRRNPTDNQPQLQFGGDRGAEFEATCQSIESRFGKTIANIKQISHGILNINDKTWHKSMREFRETTAHLEEIVDNLIINVFTCVEHVEDGIYALACFQRFSTRNKLHKTLERKVASVWDLFAAEVSTTDSELGNESAENLSNLPAVSNRIIQLNVNHRRLDRLKLLLGQNKWLPESIDTEKILANFKTVTDVMDKTVQKRLDEWVQSLGVDIVAKLNRLLLKRSLLHSGLFECNIDASIFTIFREARFLRWLGFAFPVHLSQFFARERTIRSAYDAIIAMIFSYNRTLMRLSDTERALLKPMTKVCDKAIAPGSLRITWANEGLESYISECNKNIQTLSECIRIYEQTNAKIVSNCERLCEIVVVKIPNDKPRELTEIEMLTQSHLDKQTKSISMEVEILCKLILTIHDQIENIDNELWTDFICQFDKLVEEALVRSSRESLKSIFRTFNGNGVLGPRPLLHVTLEIRCGKIIEDPSTDELQAMLQAIYEKLAKSQQKIPRLVEAFYLKAPEPQLPFVEVIRNDDECVRLQTQIQEELDKNEIKMRRYEDEWMQFAYIWQCDKASIIDKFATIENATAEKYDQKLQDLIALSNQVAIREVLSKVNFTMVDASKLRQSILLEIEKWKNMYLLSLKSKTESQIKEFFAYTNENGQKLSITPKSVEELQKCCTIYEQLRNDIDGSKCNLSSIHDQFEVLLKYGVTIDGELLEMNESIGMQWEAYLEKLNAAEEVLNNAKDSFKLTLESTRKTPDFFE